MNFSSLTEPLVPGTARRELMIVDYGVLIISSIGLEYLAYSVRISEEDLIETQLLLHHSIVTKTDMIINT